MARNRTTWRALTAAEKPLLVFGAGDGASATVDWVVGSLSRRLTRDA
jgi:hypothetical protein